MPQYLKSRTIWYAVAIAGLSTASAYVGLVFTKPWQQALAGVLIAVGIAYFRNITTQPLSEK